MVDDWLLFAAIAERGTIAAAARERGLSVPTVSRALTRLEARLGAALFHRTSRRLALSAFGQELLPLVQALQTDLQTLETAAGDASAATSGLIRLAAPMDFGRDHVAPVIARFLDDHPGIRVDLHLDDQRIDLVAQGFDLVLRIGRLADSSLLARRLCPVTLKLVASPAFVAAHGAPATPADLAMLPAFLYANQQPPGVWTFHHDDGRRLSVSVRPRASLNNGGAMLPALEAGLGIALLPDFLVWRSLADGRLMALLPEWPAEPLDLHLVTPPGGRRPARVRLLMDRLVDALAEPPWASGAAGALKRESPVF
jgi:DNA-binding transcriptional LysR family regulator